MPRDTPRDLPTFVPDQAGPQSATSAGAGWFLPDVRVVPSGSGVQLRRAPGMAVPGRLEPPPHDAPAGTPRRAPRDAPLPVAHCARAVHADGTIQTVSLLGPVLPEAAGPRSRSATPPDAAGFPGAVFVYGTLMHGEEREGPLRTLLPGVAPVGGTVAGALVHLGAWPGLVGGAGRVEGELYVCDALPLLTGLLATLDPIEDFEGFDATPTEYVRVVLPVTTRTGTRWAWSYRYVGDLRHAVSIPSGRWRDAPRRLPGCGIP